MGNRYIISFVWQDMGREVYTTVSKLFKVGNNVSYEDLLATAGSISLTLETLISTATGLKKIKLTDTKNRCHLEALEIK